MTKLEKIEQEITALSDSDRRKLAEWFAEFDAQMWDQEIENDHKAGRLDAVINAARQELADSKVRPL